MSQSEQLRSVEDLDIIVDTDAHLTEKAEQMVPYMEEPYSEMFTAAAEQDVNIAKPSYPKDELFRDLGGKIQWDDINTAEAQDEMMDRFGLDYAIITPTLNLYLPIFSDKRYAHALAKAYNDFIVDNFLDKEGHDGFKAAITVSPLDPEYAAQEIERLADHPDFVAVIIGSTGTYPALGDRRYEPIWEAVDAADLPLLLHGATGSYVSAHPQIKRALESYAELHVISHPLSQMIQMSSIVGQGIPERYPDIDVVFQEAGVGWIPYTMYRMDMEFEKRRGEVPRIGQKPSRYITNPDGPFYFTSQPMAEPDQTEHLAQLINMFNGQEKLMFSTDYPHYDFDTPEELFNMIRGHFDEEAVEKIFGGTAMKVFDL
jgi:predicted TIM-barrel fold metal-dependent hydrolase